MSFWSIQPLKIVTNSAQPILSSDQLLLQIETELAKSKHKLDYTTFQSFDDKLIETALTFINENYVSSETSKLIYDAALLKYFLIDSILIFFYPKGKTDTIVGLIIGKRKRITIENNTHDMVDVNFLCLQKRLRNLHLAPYLIGVLTKETVLKLNISLAYYTIAAHINSPCFAKKQMYHRPINITQLVKGGFFKVPVSEYEKIYNDFQTEKTPVYNEYVTHELQQKLTKLINNYSKQTYKIYDDKSILDMLSSPAFHNFTFYEYDEPVDFVSFFKIESYNNKLDASYKNGYLFVVALKSQEPTHLKAIFDSIARYCLQNNILDVLTLTDIFVNTVYSKMQFIPGTGILNYYMFNMDMIPIENSKNGLVTI